MADSVVAVKVSGEFACFSRPEFKVERVSYEVMTPSAARGVLEAIFWKPEVKWEVREIWVLNPIATLTILRNEIDRRQGISPIIVEEARQQRAALLLRDVSYVILATLRLRPHANEPLAKYLDQARRRIDRGQCHHTPYLGTREFAASFEASNRIEKPLEIDRDLGPILFDVAYVQDPVRRELSFHQHGAGGKSIAVGFAEAIFFDASLRQGVMQVPSELYRQKERLEGGNAS